MDKVIIHIPSISKFDSNSLESLSDIYYSLEDIKHQMDSKHEDNETIYSCLEKIKNEYEKRKVYLEDEIKKIKEQLEPLLFKFYKMTAIKHKNGYEYKFVSYIYPYEIAAHGEMNNVWMLKVDIDKQYKSGVCDCYYNIDDYLEYDITLEEISKEDFYKFAYKSCDDVIEYRFKRIESKLNKGVEK